MIGAIIGDIVGSRFEWNNIKTKEFSFFHEKYKLTDDSIMSLAISKALLKSNAAYGDLPQQTVKYMQKFGKKYPDAGYGGSFRIWLEKFQPEPYHSFGNGAAMRVSACGHVANTVLEAKFLANAVTKVTHNHHEGLKGAESVAVAIFLALHGRSMDDIHDYVVENYYPIDFKLDDIRETYTFDETCQGTVPQAFEAFFESVNFEDAIRNAISIGGDSDTIAAIAGSLASAYYGVPQQMYKRALTFMDKFERKNLNAFEKKYPPKIIKSKSK